MLTPFIHLKRPALLPRVLYDLALDLFSVVQYWQPELEGTARGRAFEDLFYRYCRMRKLPLSEQAGSRTFRGVKSASGFSHESDGVIALADISIHVELKHLGGEVSKNDLLIFNQKGLDFLLSEGHQIRRRPLYRVFISGGLLSPAARQFAVQWGILTIEPDRLPLLVLHQLLTAALPMHRF